MSAYWDGIHAILRATAPKWTVRKLVLTDADLAAAPPGTEIGDIIEIPNPDLRIGEF